MSEGRSDRRGRQVKTSILGTFAAVALFVVGAFFVTVFLLERQTLEADLAESAAAVDTLLRQKVEKEAKVMHGIVMAMFGNRELEEALVDQDRDELFRLVAPLFASIRAEHGMTHLYFTDADLVTLLRLHEREQFGDTIDRYTTVQARERGQTGFGLELGSLGTLTLRTVTPWRRGAATVGYVELGQEIEHLLVDIRSTLGVELFAFVDKRFMSRAQWEKGQTLLGREGRWEAFDAFALVGQTPERFSAGLRTRLAAILAGTSGGNATDGERSVYLAGLPLTVADGREIGRLVVVRDVTRLERAFQRSLIVATVVSVLAGLVVFLFFRGSLAQVERDYQRQYELELRLLRMSTEHRRMVQVEKLSAVGTMIGQIAHQLNNPLVGVVNMTQLAERQADDPVRVRELLAEIRSAGQDCSSFIQRMLGFSKVSRFQRTATDMGVLVNEAVSLFRQSVGRRVDVDVELPYEVRLVIDPILLRHALFNLLANAGQAMGGEGHVLVTLLPACSDADRDPGWLLSVEDEGPGLAPDVLDHLFTPFFSTRAEGTGLGLPVVLHVALLHGGRVDVTNRSEGGARFAIWLPEHSPETVSGADPKPDRR